MREQSAVLAELPHRARILGLAELEKGWRRWVSAMTRMVTAEVAEEWGRLNAVRPLPAMDALIAATARVNGWTLVTRNVKDFDGTGVPVVDPFGTSV